MWLWPLLRLLLLLLLLLLLPLQLLVLLQLRRSFKLLDSKTLMRLCQWRSGQT